MLCTKWTKSEKLKNNFVATVQWNELFRSSQTNPVFLTTDEELVFSIGQCAKDGKIISLDII